MIVAENLFADTLQKTDEWLRDLVAIGRFNSKAQAYSVLHAVLHTLRDRLTVDEAAQLGAQLPMLIRGIYYEGWKPSYMPGRQRTWGEFLGRIGGRLGNCEVEPEAACRAVFALLEQRISPGEIDEVKHMMHERLRDLWPTPASPNPT